MTEGYTTTMQAMPASTEAGVVADLATVAAEAAPLDPEKVFERIVPAGASHLVIDPEQFRDAPRRVTGTAVLVDAESFATYYGKHRTAGASTMYADVTSQQIVAVLNDAAGPTEPGWRDHVLTLALAKTPAWLRWTRNDGQLLGQTQFAEHIEDSLPEIVEPDAAQMLEIAQSFHAHTRVNFESSKLLDSGQRQFVYHEETTASAGSKGTIEVPKTFTLALAPFEVGENYRVQARLRFRIESGSLRIGYKLDRPNDVLRAAFKDVIEAVEEKTGETVLYGTSPG